MYRKLNVEVLVWDFDGTFYPPNPRLWNDIRNAEYRAIANHTGWPMDRVKAEFDRLHKKIIPSATETVARLCGLSASEGTVEFASYFDRTKYISRARQVI